MSSSSPRLLVTAASGQLGRLTVEALLRAVPAAQIVATARDPGRLADVAAKGVIVRAADYEKSDTLDAAFAGVDRVLLISSSAIGQRVPQHRNAIEAAKRAGVKLIAYTSVLHADKSTLGLAEEHRQTEALLKASGVPFALLRNGWYAENYAASIPSALQFNAVFGSAGNGKLSLAARGDYAEAAAAVLASADDQAGQVYELAGDTAITLADFAAELAKQTGKPITYQDMPEAAYKAALVGAGLPEGLATLLSDSDAQAAKGALFDDSGTLGKLIGHPTTPIAKVIAAALAANA